jgi:hypothetical protein
VCVCRGCGSSGASVRNLVVVLSSGFWGFQSAYYLLVLDIDIVRILFYFAVEVKWNCVRRGGGILCTLHCTQTQPGPPQPARQCRATLSLSLSLILKYYPRSKQYIFVYIEAKGEVII